MAVNIIEGKVINEGMKVGIVCARFNEFITSKLLGGALDALRRRRPSPWPGFPARSKSP